MMRRWKVALVAVSAVSAVAAPIAWAVWPFTEENRTFGPLQCNACQGQAPIPDRSTAEFLRVYVDANAYQAYGKTFFQQNPGDKLVVCNAAVCTTYEMTHSRDWLGTKTEAINNHASDGGGAHSGGGYGGGGGGGEYSGPTGGGNHGGGSGSVTVGGPSPQKPPIPTQDN